MILYYYHSAPPFLNKKLLLLCFLLHFSSHFKISIVADARGNKPIGQKCRRDSQCTSGHCFKDWRNSFWNGVCSECETDDDCEGKGISRPGELPRAFCFQEEWKKVCSPWKQGKPIDDRGYPIHIPSSKKSDDDDEGPDWVRRFNYDDVDNSNNKPTMSQVWHWDLNNQPEEGSTTTVTVNETHAIIPLYVQTLAGYSRTYHVFDDEHETGIVTTVFLNNPYSVVSTEAHSGMVEKYHTLTYDGDMPTTKSDRVKKELKSRLDSTQQKAEQRYNVRSYGMMGALIPTKTISSLVEAGQDVVHLQKMRSYVKGLREENTRIKEDDDDFWIPKESEEAKEALEYAKSKRSMKSENHCKHFEDGYGIMVTDTHIEIPLNVPWVTVSGETQISPEYYFGLNNGINIAKYDQTSNSLEFHYKAYQQYRYYADPKADRSEEAIESSLWLAPISPDYPVSDEDGRSDLYCHSEPYWYQGMLASYNTIPVDYTLYDRGNDLCTEQVLEKLSDKWDDAKLHQEEFQVTDNVFDDLLDIRSLMQVLVDGATCTNFLKADFGSNAIGFDTLEFMVMAHMVLEFDPHVTEEMGTAQFWDDWDSFYKN